ncbi:MAG TPA: methionyl-tRNA formyltransferase [candidate division Zixibacteria bacterium]|nr:methionyl-tRNA formyltransferase [candidate division Zixibacteria bacterium]HOZ08368.1 methionyl-tRNA formyltransferase [candidate division Zixibacteria bacterium]HPM37983.1 methionyl-tRNA formyltransferase [candidate division Zixibacteria bacterium]
MRLVFMGTPEYACPTLACLVHSEHEVAAVVTGPDVRPPRGGGLHPTPVKREALRHGLTVLTPATLRNNPALREALAGLKADVFVVVAFKILPRSLYALPRLGSVNIHASLLPRYRGAAPIHWALINGETETGLSSFVLNDTVDTGDLVLQERVPIDPADTFDSLYARMAALSGPFALRSLERLADPAFAPIPQDGTAATPAPKVTPEDALIDWGFPAPLVHNFIRGLSSVPGAYSTFRSRRVKILGSRPVVDAPAAPGAPPGAIVPDRRRLLVQCASSALELTRLVPEGKKGMDGVSFLNGLQPQPGERFGATPHNIQDPV